MSSIGDDGPDDNGPVSILSQDRKSLQQPWQDFLNDPAVDIHLDVLASSPTAAPVLSCTANRFKGLPFSSSSNDVQFGWKNGSTVDSQSSEYLMALAWDGTTPSGGAAVPEYTKAWSVGEIMTAFSIPLPNHPLVKRILTAIGPLVDVGEVTDETRVMQVVTSPGKRNGIWLAPGPDLLLTTRLTFHLVVPKALSEVAKAIRDEYGLFSQDDEQKVEELVQSLSFQMTQQIKGTQIEDGFLTPVTYSLTMQIPIKGFIFWIEYNNIGVSCSLTEDPSPPSGAGFQEEGLVSRLQRLGPGNNLDTSTVTPVFEDILKSVDLYRLTIGTSTAGSIYFLIELLVHWDTNGSTYIIGLTYDSRDQSFTGQLLFQGYFPSDSDRVLPSYDPRTELPTGIINSNPQYLESIPTELKLGQVFADTDSSPPGMPTRLIEAQITYSNLDKMIFFYASIADVGGGVTEKPPVPSPFTWDAVAVRAAYAKSIGVSFDIACWFSLNPRTQDRDLYPTANLGIRLRYSQGSWSLSGSVKNLYFGVLGSYMPELLSDPFLDSLGKVALADLELDYTFTNPTKNTSGSTQPAKAASFVISAKLLIGGLELDLIYQYASSAAGKAQTAAQKKYPNDPRARAAPKDPSKPEWFFEAHLNAANQNATIGSIADSFVTNASRNLPDFVRQISITPSAGASDLVYLKVMPSSGDSLACVLQISVGIFQLTLVQIAGKDVPTKRMFRLVVNQIPMISNIPLVQQLPQPFDSLVYLWVLDSSNTGWTGQDLANLDALNLQSPILTKSTISSPDPKMVVIPLGHHFMVIDGGKTILDHVFGQPDEKMNDDPDEQGDQHTGQVAKPEVPPTKGAMAKKTKFLTLSNIGLQYKDGTLWLMLDATVSLGPIEINLLGFEIGLPIGKKFGDQVFTLQNFANIADHIEVQIQGLGVSFERPPLVLAGAFEHDQTSTEDTYRGGIAVSFAPYVFVAVGQYSIVRDSAQNPYKSVFVFAKLNGPLVTLEFATISGVRLGFGYNSLVRSPAITELTDFPFINDDSSSGTGDNPIQILKNMTQGTADKPAWVSVKQDSYWFAAGMSIVAFDVLAITAVAMLAFKDAGIVASIYADAVAKMPSTASNDDTGSMIVFVEIGMVAEMNFVEDYFKVEAALAPTSFLLVPQCHVYGGFALCYWYGNNPHAGDWVFSVGGFHKSFTPPAWYPVPGRLGANFSIGGGLSVTAEAYFAVTPKCVMGGAMLHVSLDVGPISAYLDASFDALVNLNPLHYIVDMRISVGVTCDINILFIHIHISCSVGADLHIEGPEFGGVAHVDFYLFGFDVTIGSHPGPPDPIDLSTFYDLVHKAGPQDEVDPSSTSSSDSSSEQVSEKIPETMKHLKFTMEDGAFPMPQKDKPAGTTGATTPPNAGIGSAWHVKGGSFQFRIACSFAISDAQIQQSDSVSDFADVPGTDQLGSIYSSPMQVTKPVKSTLIVSIVSQEHGTVQGKFQSTYILKPVPSKLWASYRQDHDPMNATDRDEMKRNLLSTDDATTSLAMGVSLHSPRPQLARSRIPDFNASEANKMAVFDPSTDGPGDRGSSIWSLASTEAKQSSYLPTEINQAASLAERAAQWADTRTKWQQAFKPDLVGDGKGVGSGMLGLAAQALGWNNPGPAQKEDMKKLKGARKPWELKGAFPQKLVVGHVNADQTRDGGLEAFYLDLPQFCSVVG